MYKYDDSLKGDDDHLLFLTKRFKMLSEEGNISIYSDFNTIEHFPQTNHDNFNNNSPNHNTSSSLLASQVLMMIVFVMVIVVGNGHSDTVQILGETDCISHSTNTLGKGMNPIILPPAMVNSRADCVLQPW